MSPSAPEFLTDKVRYDTQTFTWQDSEFNDIASGFYLLSRALPSLHENWCNSIVLCNSFRLKLPFWDKDFPRTRFCVGTFDGILCDVTKKRLKFIQGERETLPLTLIPARKFIYKIRKKKSREECDILWVPILYFIPNTEAFYLCYSSSNSRPWGNTEQKFEKVRKAQALT